MATKVEFLACLDHIVAETRQTGVAPVLQIETHGNREGIGATALDAVRWNELKGPLTDINVACGLNLFVLAAACKGFSLRRVLQPKDRAPIWGVIGPERNIYPSEIEAAHAAFWESVLSSGDGHAAKAAMNAAVCGAPFHFMAAEELFIW